MDELGACLEVNIFYTCNLIDLDNCVLVMGGKHLCSISPISFVSVVFLGVV